MDRLTPSRAYLDQINSQVEADIAATEELSYPDPDYPEQPKLWQRVAAAVESYQDDLVALSLDLHAHPEVAFEEHRSAAAIAELLEQHGVSVTRQAFGVETALHASWATTDFDPQRHPTIAVLSEYDALPGIGHACGHNVIAACGVGGFLSALEALKNAEIPGRLVFLGTPAEEGHSGKEYLIRGGAFEGVDAAIMIHPFSYDIGSHVWVGRRNLSVTFRGVAAHASSEPFMGRNALDAATLAYQGLGLLRQQMPHSDRLHAIIDDGGERASIIPESASMSIYVRSLYTDTLLDLSSRVDDIIEGAALMAGVTVEKKWDVHPATLPVRNNETLVARWTRTQVEQGRQPLPAGIIPATLAASTDFGNVSQLVPGLHPMVKIAPVGVALHTEGMERAAASEEAATAIVHSATGLGQVAIDALADPILLARAREEFAAEGGVVRSADLFGA